MKKHNNDKTLNLILLTKYNDASIKKQLQCYGTKDKITIHVPFKL